MLQQYILRIVKAVYLGAEYLILSDVVRLHYDADFSLLRDLVRTLLEHQISILLTDSYQNPLFICSDACRILRFEGGMFVAMAKRYALYNWRLLIIHLPNINPTGVEAKIFQTLINELANRGTSVLVVVAASSEILTRADNLFEFDQEGNCYQKLDHQNHR